MSEGNKKIKEIEEIIINKAKKLSYFNELTEKSQKELLTVLKRFWIYSDNSPEFENNLDKCVDWFWKHFKPVFKS
jgi:hypothetical protein